MRKASKIEYLEKKLMYAKDELEREKSNAKSFKKAMHEQLLEKRKELFELRNKTGFVYEVAVSMMEGKKEVYRAVFDTEQDMGALVTMDVIQHKEGAIWIDRQACYSVDIKKVLYKESDNLLYVGDTYAYKYLNQDMIPLY